VSAQRRRWRTRDSKLARALHGDWKRRVNSGAGASPAGPSVEAAHRPNSLKVDLEAISGNAERVRQLLDPRTQLFAAVKANAYGFGLPRVAQAMLAGGADAFSMADPADALRIRADGIDVPLLLYGGVLPERAMGRLLAEHDLTCTVADLDAARAWSDLAFGVRAFLKIDVGLERLGVPAEQAAEFAVAACSLPGIRVEGIYTHLHGGETPGYAAWQLDRFDLALDGLASEGIALPVRMAESSVTIGGERRARLNAVDPGHLLYGFRPVGRSDTPAGIRPAFASLTTRVIHVKQVSRPAFAESAPAPLREGMRIAVIPLGRADGIRSLTCGEVLVRERRAPIVGRPSLEHTRVDVTDVPDCRAGDEVVIIGRQGAEEISFDEVAARHGLDGVGLVLEARPTVRRVYGTTPA
jgi:alanine racemase